MPLSDEEQQLWLAVIESNRAWRSGSMHELANFYDEKAVAIAPQLSERLDGREAILASYADYHLHARTHEFEEQEHQIALFGDTAVVTYRFHIRYELLAEGEMHDESAQEILVLKKTDRWRVIFRTQTAPESV
jgi:ketosteroid isomerase-like protein